MVIENLISSNEFQVLQEENDSNNLDEALAFGFISNTSLLGDTSKFASVPFKNCSSPKDIAQNIQILANVWPPIAGENAKFLIKGILNEDITSGEFHMRAQLFLFSVHRTNAFPKLCLPKHKGPFSLAQQFLIPNAPIHGTAHVTIKLNTEDGIPITCLKFQIHV